MPTLQEQIAQVLAAQSARPRRPALGRSILQAPKVTAPPPDARAAVRQAVLGAGRAGLSTLGALGEALDQRPRGVPRDLSTSPGRLLNLPGSILAAGASELADALAGTRTPTTIDPMGAAPQTSFADVGQRIGGLPGTLAGMAADIAVPGPGELTTLGKLGTLSPLKAMIAYHGTPHRFPATPENPLGVFDASKIGTGEGAQAYGHGIYFTENPEVGKYYKEYLSGQGGYKLVDEKGKDVTFNDLSSESLAEIYLNGAGGNYDKAKKELMSLAESSEEYAPTYIKAVNAIDALKQQGIKAVPKGEGSLYTTDLPDEMIDRMLDWDKPLSEQPTAVREALRRRITSVEPTDKFDMGGNAVLRDNRLGQYDKTRPYPWILEASGANGTSAFGLSQKDVDQMFGSKDASNLLGKQIISRLTQQQGGQAAASKYLADLGIPGIKYLDAGSRYQGGGTRNFVVFPGEEQKVKILKRE